MNKSRRLAGRVSEILGGMGRYPTDAETRTPAQNAALDMLQKTVATTHAAAMAQGGVSANPPPAVMPPAAVAQRAYNAATALYQEASAWLPQAQAALGLPVTAATIAQWVPNMNYASADRVQNGGNAYKAVQGGQSGQSGPTGNNPTKGVIDGSVTWVYTGVAPVAAADQGAMPFDPGQAGGGGGGGGSDDGGGSGSDSDAGPADDGGGARTAGGAPDPFADEDNEETPSALETGSGAFEADSPTEALDAARELLEDDMLGEEADDLFSETYSLEITDEAPDYERGRASAHYGAAYLEDITYPPGGASSGQEGGNTYPVSSGEVEVFGGSSYSHGLDILGAGPAKAAAPAPRAGFVVKATPAGNKITSLVIGKTKKGDNATSIKNARDAGKRAQEIGKKLLAAVPKVAAANAKTLVKGAVAKKPGHVKLGPAAVKIIAKKAIDAGKSALGGADKHQALVTTKVKREKAAAVALSKKQSNMGGKTSVHGEEIEVLGHYADMLGDEMNALAATQDQDSQTVNATDPTTGQNLAAGPPNKPPVLVPYQDFTPDPGVSTDGASYSSTGDATPIPQGAIFYDGSRGADDKWNFRSFNSFKNPERCFYWAGNHWDAAMQRGMDPSWSGTVNEARSFLKSQYNVDVTNASSPVDIDSLSRRMNWGPLVGAVEKDRPTYGLRYDHGGDKYFWYYDMAPDWAKAPVDMVRLNQAILDYQAQVAAAAADAAASAAQDAQDAQDARQAAKDQAASDAEMAKQQAQDEQEANRQRMADEAAAAQQQREQELEASRNAAQADIDRQNMQAQAEIDDRRAQAAADAAPRSDAQEQGDDEAREPSAEEMMEEVMGNYDTIYGGASGSRRLSSHRRFSR